MSIEILTLIMLAAMMGLMVIGLPLVFVTGVVSLAFALALCVKCEECAYPDPCLYPDLARPSMDAYGMDIGKTVEIVDFKVEFSEEGVMLPAWYSMVLLD